MYFQEREVDGYGHDREREAHSFLDTLSDTQDSICIEELGDGTSIFNGDSVRFEGFDINRRLFCMGSNVKDEDENDNEDENIIKNILPQSTKLRGTVRQKGKLSRGVVLVAENSKRSHAESSLDLSEDYGTQYDDSYEIIEQEENSVRQCGCHKSRKAKCFKELEIESLEKGDIKKSLFYKDINEWCKEYEINKTREICVPLIHEFCLNKGDSDSLF
ncbi:YGR153W-like protein [Saccharomyces cerevisiae x Saccharomyces kudriavzevii VIN7]|uniref:YGR153W-like protein n=1 Tax=Saccharomyces cerevisiae x Saccharomyces kudriavzevii (strain VIN7) TaxID=1095631 RepID=H0GV77_SACCK|nr:YGR153W-like protein [Saccharomyces cerevisiae x Saccharomyces kudriavzevii VIN7]CAI5274288.1 AIS_HP2_G0020280.mRNA.1.CDS.1 [Saccharomyces cerevisiae]CAI6526197.1 AIS_HP2_G0020280.mRNA.1.CDS.1 [Saccharomyces cerevisiae]